MRRLIFALIIIIALSLFALMLMVPADTRAPGNSDAASGILPACGDNPEACGV